MVEPLLMPSELHQIERLLALEWDPIGVGDIEGEYNRYAAEVHAMLLRGAEPEEIARHLTGTVETLMGISTTDEHSLQVARQAYAIHVGRSG